MGLRAQKRQGANEPLSDNEGSLLGLVLRRQPVTAYQLFKVYEQSPVTSFNASKGSLYPLINRLKAAGLIEAERKEGDGRNAETLRCSEAGAEAVRRWLKDLKISHVMLDDPLRTMMLSLDRLTRDEQIEWVADAKALVQAKMAAVEAYSRSVSVPFQDIAHRSTTEMLRVKMEWLDALLYQVVKQRDV
ncbi:MAG TPA: PadR family transcriptional regulator [Allosphingosinicella sp.]|jgi:DNA-binding PadR family transcriptional regulator